MSRQVINTLLDTQSEKASKPTTTIVVEEEKLPEFDHTEITNFSNLSNNADVVEESAADQVILSLNDEEEKFNENTIDSVVEDSTLLAVEEDEEIQSFATLTEEKPPVFNPIEDAQESTPQTFDDIMEILENIDRSAREEEDRKESQRLLEIEKQKAEEEARLIQEQVDRERAERDRFIPAVEIPDEFELAEQRSKQPIPLHDSENQPTSTVEIPEYIQTSLNNELNNSQQTQKQETESVVDDGIDDLLNPDDLPTQKEYKDILLRIFAHDIESEVINFPVVESNPPEIEESVVATEKEESEQVYDRIVDELDFSNQKQPTTNEIASKQVTEQSKPKKNSVFDYSDIIEMSAREGFKINTSDRTNKSELGKILINRLNFHTALIFFILIAFETLLVALTMENVLTFGVEPYIYFSIGMLLFPIITGSLYYMAPKRTVGEVSTFKSAFETALIITLNLVLLILVYTVIIDLDFSSYQQLTRNLFLPLLIVINVPIYVIIRYSLLEKQMYFS